MYFGERLEYLRHEKKLTQKQLADKLGMSSGMISSYERSISLPDIAQLKKFCDFFDVTPSYFLCYTNIPAPISPKKNQLFFIPNSDELSDEMKEEICKYSQYLIYKKNKG